MTDEEKHLEVMLGIESLKTIMEKVVEPAVSQTYENKEDINTLEVNLRNHEKTHSTKHQNKRDNKSTIALFISGVIAFILLVKAFILDKIH